MQVETKTYGDDRFVSLHITTKNGLNYRIDVEVLDEHFDMPELQILPYLEGKPKNTVQIGTPGQISFFDGKQRVKTRGTTLLASSTAMGGIWVNWREDAFDPFKAEIDDILKGDNNGS
jgi:hypothetical protein